MTDMDSSDAPLRDRLSFDVVPALDPSAARDRHILVSDDEWNTGALIVIPLAVAQFDVAYIHAIAHSATVSELRQHAVAWAAAAERYDETTGDPGNAEELPDDTIYDAYEWFGGEGLVYLIPLARLRTAETAPGCLDHLMRPDDNIGMDYEPAPWLASDDRDQVERTLIEHGYDIVHDDQLVLQYSRW